MNSPTISESYAFDRAAQVLQMNLRAQEAVVDAVYGPAAMPDVERALVNKILTSIYGESS